MYGISGPLLSWLSSYLTGRTQQVIVLGKVSSSFNTFSGVPQGGHLSPLLFLLFINDVKLLFKFCKFSLFADDLKMYIKINSVNDCEKLQSDLVRFSNWCSTNKLKINIDKCAIISFTRRKNPLIHKYSLDNHPITLVSSIKDLGIILSNDLSFNEHISYIYSKAMCMLGFVRRQCCDFNNIICLKTLYCSLVRSGLEYGSIIWNPYQSGLIQRLDRVQCNFLRHLVFKFELNVSADSLGRELGLHSLTSRRTFNDVSFIFKLLNNKISSPEILERVNWKVPAFNARSTTTFHVPFHSQSYSFNEPLSRMLRNCNSVAFDFNFENEFKLRCLCLGFG